MTDNRVSKKHFMTGVGALAAGSLVFPAGVAHAEPEQSPEEIEDRIDELTSEADTLVQDYNEAKENLDAAEKRLESLENEVGDEEERYEELRTQVAQFASAAYQSDDLSSTTTILSVDDPEEILEQSDDLSHLSESQQAQLEEFADTSERLLKLKQEAEDTRDEAKEKSEKLKKKKEEVEDKLAEQEELLAEHEEVAPDTGSATGGSYSGSASGDARTALDFAYSKIGTPYQWGGTGPNGYDCSGLMQAAWSAAGVSIPRTTYAQYELPNKVSYENLQPGDIMFFGEDIGHNGMYAGNGKMVHAPSSGKTVMEVDLADYWQPRFVGAVRP